MITGKILSHGFGCDVLAYDPYPNEAAALEAGLTYVDLPELLSRADIISLHCPLLPSTKYLLNEETLGLTKKGVVIVNTSRGALIDTTALIQNLKSGHIGAVGLDVYEHEEEYFFRDGSGTIMHDDVFSRLLSFYNVFVSGHQAFLTKEVSNLFLSMMMDFCLTLLLGARFNCEDDITELIRLRAGQRVPEPSKGLMSRLMHHRALVYHLYTLVRPFH